MIARLALAEGGIAYEPVFVDIHVRMSQQRPDYVRLNPNMTVPTLVGSGRSLGDSRAIAEYALGVEKETLNAETKAWLDRHYAFPIEELTFGRILARNPMARIMIPRRLHVISGRLLARAADNPDLADVYRLRAAVFAQRARVFDANAVIRLSEQRLVEAVGIMDHLEQTLGDGRSMIASAEYGLADVAFTVFLGRMEFSGLGAEISGRPSLARYWRVMRARPSFSAADIWTKLHVFRLICGILGIGGG